MATMCRLRAQVQEGAGAAVPGVPAAGRTRVGSAAVKLLVRVALLAFVVGAFFHPIAYQFYFFCVAGLAVALKRVCRLELQGIRERA